MKFLNKVKQQPKVSLIILAFLAFIALGMPDGLLGVAWPSIRTSFNIPIDAVGILLTACVAGYMTSSFFSGPLVARLGVGRLLTISCLLTGTGLIGYTLVPQWWMMVLLGVVSGLGAGAIDAGLNTYTAANFGEGVMQWLHAFYGIGVTLGPIIMTFTLVALNTWRPGYRLVGGFQLLLGTCFLLTLAMWSRHSAPTAANEPRRLTDYKTPLGQTILRPAVWLSIALFFVYVGAETTLGVWTYSLLSESRHVNPATAGIWAGSYWATFTIGRILAGLFPKKLGTHTLVLGGTSLALLGASLLAWNPAPFTNFVAVALIGFAIAPIFPAMMSGTSQRVGAQYAANTIGMQMTATGLGAALLPGLSGVLARHFSLEVIPFCLLALFAGLFALYRLAIQPPRGQHNSNQENKP